MGDWIQTYTNVEFDIFNATENDVLIIDIAHALSNICRFGGHCKEFYSVAQHSIHVSQLVQPKYKLHALLHDASEAYLGDIPRPIKHSHEFKFYRGIEKNISSIIYKKYKLPEELHSTITNADTQMLMLEANTLMPTITNWTFFSKELLPDNIEIYPILSSLKAKEKFLELFEEYIGIRSSSTSWNNLKIHEIFPCSQGTIFILNTIDNGMKENQIRIGDTIEHVSKLYEVMGIERFQFTFTTDQKPNDYSLLVKEV